MTSIDIALTDNELAITINNTQRVTVNIHQPKPQDPLHTTPPKKPSGPRFENLRTED